MFHAKDLGRFYAKDASGVRFSGLGFTRLDDGGVIVQLPGASVQAEAGEATVILDADTWASVVSAMRPDYDSRGLPIRRKAEQ